MTAAKPAAKTTRAKPGPKTTRRTADDGTPLEGEVVKRDESGRIVAWSLLSDTVRARLIEALLAGSYVEEAVVYAGISRQSFYNWINTGREVRERTLIDPDYEPVGHEAGCLDLLDAVEQSQASASVAAVGIIRRAAREGDWKAAAWWLERTQPKKWGRFRDDTGPQASEAGAVVVSLEELEDKVRQVIAQREQQSR